MTTYLLAGGGTAGHVNPLLAVADRLREQEPDARLLVLGTAEGLEARLVPARGYELLTIPKLPMPRRPNRAALAFPKRLLATVSDTQRILRDRGVDIVVGFGGYVCPPAYLAARREGIPIAIHEANAKPGIANRLGSLLTKHVGVTFQHTRLRHATVVGMPLRSEIETLDARAARAEALAFFGLSDERPTLLVTGGSTGARRINETISASVTLLLGAGWQVLHLTGDRAQVDDPALDGYRIVKYVDRMEFALSAANLAVSRSGAATVTEFAALGIPAVFVPYPVGNGEQRFNARDMADAGAAMLVQDAEFTPVWVREHLVPLLLDPARVADMTARAHAIGRRDGTDRMVALIRDALADRTA